jgi:hypothetical protein
MTKPSKPAPRDSEANPPPAPPKAAPPPRPVNPAVRYITNRIFRLITIVAVIVAIIGACAIFSPTFFSQMVQAAQSAGLKVYTIVLGATGSAALKVTTYEADVTVSTTVSRDMGVLSILYGESAQITGTVRVGLGADLKNGLFGVLSCDIDTNHIVTSEGRSILAGAAFDPQQIKQDAYNAFESQASQQAIADYWAEAKKRLQGQFTSWALGVVVPDKPTLTNCPANVALQPTVTPKP